MTQNYTQVFGSDTIPPAGQGYSALSLTSNSLSQWIYNYSGTTPVITKIMEVSCNAGNTLTMPPANQVSNGEDVIIRNVGSNLLTVLKNDGTTLATIAASLAQYIYVTDNTTVAGVWGQIQFGAGSASVNAAALVGYGLTAIANTLNVAFPVLSTAGNLTLALTNRDEAVTFTGGSATLTLLAVATAGNGFTFFAKNAGSGAVTLTPQSGEMIDGQSTLILQPDESAMIVCSGTAWFTVGYGRSILYQFNQLVLDVSAAGTFILTATQASNKLLTFVGNPGSAVTVQVPNVVAIYYIQSQLSTNQNVTVKTAAGTGVVVPQSQRTIAIDDGTNVSSALTVTSTTNLSLIDGTVTNPSLSFASQANTGVFKSGSTGFGISANGTLAIDAQDAGVNIPIALTVASSTVPTVGSSPTLTGTWTFSNAIVGSVTGNAAGLSTTLIVAQGGTGLPTLTAHNVLLGEGTSNVAFADPGTAGNVLTSNGASSDPTFQALPAGGTVTAVTGSGNIASSGGNTPNITLTGQVPPANGGTGLATLTVHNVLLGEGTSNVAFAAPGTAGQILTSNGASADPSFAVLLATVGQGGTGLATLTAHNVLLGEGTSNVAFAAPGTAGQVLTSNGAASDPTFQASTGSPTTFNAVGSYAIGAAVFYPGDGVTGSASSFGVSGGSGTWRAMGQIVPARGGCCPTNAVFLVVRTV